MHLSEQHKTVPRLRTKPSSSKLRSATTKTTTATSRSSPPMPGLPESVQGPSTAASPISLESHERRPSGLPKPISMASMERSATPVGMTTTTTATLRPHMGPPPTKHHPAFSLSRASHRVSASLGSAGASSSTERAEGGHAPAESGKRFRGMISRDMSKSTANSAAAQNIFSSSSSYTLGTLRTGSTTSFNGSTVSPSTSTSSLAGPRNAAARSSVLGITPPAPASSSNISSNSSTPRFIRKLSEGDVSNVPRSFAAAREAVSTPVYPASASDSSPSTRYTESPGALSHSSTPTSVSSYSSSIPAAMLRVGSSSPPRALLSITTSTKSRSGSTAGLDVSSGYDTGLDSVRESTTSTSSSSTVKASERGASSPYLTKRPVPPSVESLAEREGVSSPAPAALAAPSAQNRLQKARRLAPSPQIRSAKSPSPPVLVSSRDSRRNASTSSIPSLMSTTTTTSRQAGGGGVARAAGLGLSIPTAADILSRNRSKSLGSHSNKAISTSPPPPSPGIPPEHLLSTSSSSGSVHGREPTPRPRYLRKNTHPQLLPPADPSRLGISPIKRSNSRDLSTSSPLTKPAPLSKLGFFSRVRTKTSGPMAAQQEKAPRKGPAAGTGHEGYGSFSKGTARGRSGSTSSTSGGSYVRSGSQSSAYESRGTSGSRRGSRTSTAETDMDDYLLDRLKPVVIVGGEVVENHNIHRYNNEPDMSGGGGSHRGLQGGSGSTGGVDMVQTGSDQGSMQSADSGHSGISLMSHHHPTGSGAGAGLTSRANSSQGSLAEFDKENLIMGSRRAFGYKRTRTPIPSPIITSGRRMPIPTPSPVSSFSSSSRKPSIDRPELRSGKLSAYPTLLVHFLVSSRFVAKRKAGNEKKLFPVEWCSRFYIYILTTLYVQHPPSPRYRLGEIGTSRPGPAPAPPSPSLQPQHPQSPSDGISYKGPRRQSRLHCPVWAAAAASVVVQAHQSRPHHHHHR